MDLRGADEAVKIRELIDKAIMGVCTSIPAIVDAFNPLTMTVDVTPAIQMKVRQDEVDSWVDLGKIVNVPAVIYGGGGFFHTVPIAQGDNCLLVFSQRAIDNWHDQGGIQPAGDDDNYGVRHHDMTDAFALFSPQPIVSALTNYSTNAMELRNKAGTVKISVGESSVILTVGSTTLTVSDGAISVSSADLDVDGDIESNGDVSDSVSSMQDMRDTFNTHTHPGVQTGSGTSGATTTPMV